MYFYFKKWTIKCTILPGSLTPLNEPELWAEKSCSFKVKDFAFNIEERAQNPPWVLVLKSIMEDFRSKSCGDGRMQIVNYHGSTAGGPGFHGNGIEDLRCYSASYASSVAPPPQTQQPQNNDAKFKKGKSTNGSSSRSWSFNDPELQRKKRVASYKVYTVEGKVKGSFKKSFRWIKERCSRVVYGWW